MNFEMGPTLTLLKVSGNCTHLNLALKSMGYCSSSL